MDYQQSMSSSSKGPIKIIIHRYLDSVNQDAQMSPWEKLARLLFNGALFCLCHFVKMPLRTVSWKVLPSFDLAMDASNFESWNQILDFLSLKYVLEVLVLHDFIGQAKILVLPTMARKTHPRPRDSIASLSITAKMWLVRLVSEASFLF
jgi:hypothetical protein